MENIIDKIKVFICRRWEKLLAILVIPIFVFCIIFLVKYKLLDGEIGGIIGVLVLLLWGVVAGALRVFGTEEWKVVAVVQAVMWVILFVVGIRTKYIDFVLFVEIVIVEAIIAGGSFFVSKTIKEDPKFIIFVIAAIMVWNVLRLVVEADLLNSMIVTVFADIVIGKIYQYYVECEEVCLLRKLGENKFNKEYFDIYYNLKSISYRVLYYVSCASVVLYEKNRMIRNVADCLWKESKICTSTNLIQYLIQYISKGEKDFGFTFIIFIFIILIILIIVGIATKCFISVKNIDKLIREKKNNFESYTQREEEIILE